MFPCYVKFDLLDSMPYFTSFIVYVCLKINKGVWQKINCRTTILCWRYLKYIYLLTAAAAPKLIIQRAKPVLSNKQYHFTCVIHRTNTYTFFQGISLSGLSVNKPQACTGSNQENESNYLLITHLKQLSKLYHTFSPEQWHRNCISHFFQKWQIRKLWDNMLFNRF